MRYSGQDGLPRSSATGSSDSEAPVRLLLFFPPQCRPFHAHLSLPILKAEAERRGHACKIVDLNLRFYEHALSRDALQQALDSIGAELDELDALAELTGPGAVRLARIATAVIRSDYILEHLDEAKMVLKTAEEFYDYGRLQWSVRVLEDALELYSAAYGCIDIGLSQLRTRFATGSPAQLWQGSDMRSENPFVDLLAAWADEAIADFRPDVIGISIGLDEQLLPSFTLARHLRATWPGVLVAGGSMVTRLRDELPGDERFGALFDRYMPYEAERALGDLLDELAGRPPARAVSFSKLCPDFSDLPLDSYFLPVRVLPYQSSRGCSYGRCHYCSHYKTYDRFVLGDAADAAGHLKYLSERYGCRYYYFVDEELMPRFGLDLANAIRDADVDIRWMVFGRLHRLWTPEVARRFAEAGCRRLIFGLDAGSERIQQLMGKNTDLDYASQILRWCSDEGIALQINLITGFPGESEQEARESVDFIRRNRESLDTVGSNTAIANFALVRDAGWDQMALLPVVDPDRRFAMYYSYRLVGDGLGMHQTPALADGLQREADRTLDASRRWPALREFAFLYREHYGASQPPPRTRQEPYYGRRTHWFSHDIRLLLRKLSDARKDLPVVPLDHHSIWWQLSEHADVTSRQTESMHGYRLAALYDDSGFQLALAEALDAAAYGALASAG